MSFTNPENLNLLRDQVRLLIDDTDRSDPENCLFTDSQIDAALSLEKNNVKRSAAFLCLSLSAKYAKQAKRAELLDGELEFDPAGQAKAYRDLAQRLRDEADFDEARDGDQFLIAEFTSNEFAAERRLSNEYLREGW